MRKIALTLAYLAVLFVASASGESWRSDMGGHAADSEQMRLHKDQQAIPTTLDAPILTHHLQRAPVQKSLGVPMDSTDNRLRTTPIMEADSCENYDKTRL